MPTVDYRADAKTLAFNDIVVETLSLAGKARVDADQILVPVAGRAARIRGLDTVAGGRMMAVLCDGRAELPADKSEEHTSELQSLMRISYAVFCLKKKKQL